MSGPSAATLIGEEIPLVVTFDNTSSNPADIGYSPFVDIVMPATGDAPPAPDDGISFKSGSATYNGLALPTTVLTFNASGQATHPFAKNPDGSAVVVTGKPGDELVVVQLPFGSYGPDQPAAEIRFTGVVSPLAQPTTTYDVTATGGFRYQTDASGNPTVDVAEFGAESVDPIQPRVFRISKSSSAPESETATGPNFQHTYNVSMAVAPGQTVTDLLLEDVLPGAVQFVSLTSVSGNGATTITPVATPSTTVPGGTLSRRFDQVVGTGSNSDVRMTFTYYVAQQDAAGNDVIPLDSGGTETVTNTASATGTWTSANPNFPNPQTIASDPADADARASITARTVALQKSFVNLTNPGSARAGDTIEYTLNFQVSDFFALDDLAIADILSDGQAFDASFTPTITFTQQSESLSGSFDPANYTTAFQADGTQTVDFDVAAELATLGLSTGTQTLGAGIPPGGTGSPATLPDPQPAGPGTRGTITFRARVLNAYRVTPRPGAAVVQGDRMNDVATIEGDVLDYPTLTNVVGTATDGSSKSFTLVSGGATKTVYAVNGTPVSGTPVVTAGDAVTFRVTYTLPFSRIKDYQITDYLPLPTFAAQNLTFAGGGPSSTAPGAGQWSFGPTDTFSQAPIGGPNPGTATANAASNSITWNFGTFADPADRPGKTDILFTVTASNRPFGDGVLLTNQALQSERNETDDLLTSNTALAQVQLSEPLLGITKGVVSTNNASGVFTPTPVAPAGVTFAQPGQSGAAFTGTINSNGLAATPIDATLSNVLANDLVKFTIIVENTGTGSNGAFDVAIKDTFDATRFQIPGGGTGLNLQVTDGTGTALAYTGAPTDLFGSGIQLVDPGATTGSLTAGNPSSGTNVAVISYDLQLRPDVVPLDVIPNTATLTNYASAEGGPNFLPPAGISDDTTVTIQSPAVSKTLVGTSIVDTWNSNTQAVIGELVTYDLRVEVPQGTTPAAVLTDTFTDALGFVRVVGTPTVDPGVTVAGLANINSPSLSDNGRVAEWNLGDIINSNTDDQLHGITFRIEAVVLNSRQVPTPIAGPRNQAQLAWTGHTLPAVQADPVQVIEPKVTIDKTVSPTTAQASDTATFTIVVTASQTTSHNVDLEDILPAGITYVPGSLTSTAGVTPTTLGTASGGRSVEATWTALNPGQTSTLTFQATLNADVTVGQAIINTATTKWTSLPGNPGQITPNSTIAYERTGSGSTSQGQLNNYTTSDSATVTVAKPTVAKTLVSTSIVNAANSNTQAVIGELATYDVTVTIPQGRTPAAELLDRMAPGLAFVRQISAVNNDPAVLVVPGLADPAVLTENGTVATWSLGDIVNTDTDSSTAETITFRIETVVLNVTSNTAGVTINNRARLFWNNRANFSNNAQNRDVTVIEPKLRTSKAVTVGGLGGNPGDPVTYTIVIEQDPTSQTDAFDATLNDVLPAEIDAPVLASVVDTAGVVTDANFDLSGNTLSTTTPFDLEKNPAGRTITLTITGTLQGPFTANQQIVNTNSVRWTSLNGSPGQITPNNPDAWERTGSGSTSQGELNNYVTTATAAFTVNTADLAVTKTVDNPTPNVGDTITFTVTVSNNGPDAATDVELTDTFPAAGLQIVGTPTVSQGTYEPATGVWDIGTVLAGGGNAQTLTIQALVLAPAVNTIPVARTNTAEITNAAEPDPNPANNRDDATETPRYADLGVKKTTNNVRPNVSEPITYTVSIFNLGTSAATNVEVTDAFPTNVSYVSHSAAAGTFDPATGIWSLPTVPLTATVTNPLTLTINVLATASGIGFNRVTITKSDVWDPNDRNNTAQTPTDPQEAHLVLSKTADDTTPNVGDTVTYTITVDNTGPNTAANAVVVDQIPAGITYVPGSASNGGVYDPATRLVTWSLGSLPVGQIQLTVQATVDTPTSGSILPINNQATVTSPTPDPTPGNNTDDETITPLQADMAVFKQVSDATPNVGDTIEYSIAAHNFGPATATSVVVTDSLPAGLTYVSHVAPAGTTYDPTTGIWTVGTVSAGDARVLTVRMTVDPPSPAGIPAAVTNDVAVTAREYDPDRSNNTDSATETPQYADLAVAKTVSDPRPNVGDTITFTVTVSNLGLDAATGVTLLDQLPTGLGFVSAQPSVGTYDAGTGIWTIGTVDTTISPVLVINAEVLPPASGIPQPQTNEARINTADQYDPDPSNNTASATETPRYADLAVTKQVDDPAPNVGGQVTFTIEITNLGADPATGVEVRDLLPAGLTFVSAGPSSGTNYDPSTGIWTVGTLPVGGIRSLTMLALVAASGQFTNQAAVSATEVFDPDPSNDRDSATVTTREADLAVVKTVNDPAPNVGDTVTFTITVSNDGPDIANNVALTDTLPAGLQFVAATPSQGTFDPGTGVWTVGTVDLGAANAQTLTLAARVLAPAANTIPPALRNVATVTAADEHDPNPGNNTGTATVTPRYADLGVKKTTNNVQPNVGERVTYTVRLFNLGTSDATTVEVTDTLPTNVTFISATPSAGTFTSSPTGGVWSIPTVPTTATVANPLTLTIVVEATSSSVAFNTATITHSDVWDPNDRNNSARTPTDPQEADIFVTKTVDDATPNVGDTVSFTITLGNLGPNSAANVRVDDLLPAGLRLESATPSAGTYDAGTGVWTLGTVAANALETLVIAAEVRRPAAGPVPAIDNTATATTTTTDPNPGNNTDTAHVVPQQADLAVFKTVDNPDPTVGETITFEITVANYGPDTATNVAVDDGLPAGLTYVSSAATQGAYDPGTGIWTVGTVTTADTPSLLITVRVDRRVGGTVTNTATVSARPYDPDPANNTSTVEIFVRSSGVILGTDFGCVSGPLVRVIDPETGADRTLPFYAYEPTFRGGVRVYGADITGDGVPEILTAPGPGRPGEVRVFSETGVPLSQYNFYPFGQRYRGGVEIAAGSVTGAGQFEIVTGQSRGGSLVRVFTVNPGTGVDGTAVRQLQPFGRRFRGGVSVATADVGTFAGRSLSSTAPDGIDEIVVGSGAGIPTQVRVFNAVPQRPALTDVFRVIGQRYRLGASVSVLPGAAGQADRVLVSGGQRSGSTVETWRRDTGGFVREAAFSAYGSGSRAAVFAAALDSGNIFSVEGLGGTVSGVRKNTAPDGGTSSEVPQTTGDVPPLRIGILRE